MNTTTPPGGTILVVDDTPSNLKVLFDYLNDAGFKVLVAENGETALVQVRHIYPDLILLDIMMPGIDGYETCRRLKKIDDTRSIPVIFLTALADTESKIKGFEAGGVDYITKPLQHEEVLARISTHLTIQHLRRSLEERNSVLHQEIEKHRRAQATVRYLDKELKTQQSRKIFTKSTAMQNAMKIVKRVSTTDCTVLIEGETGCGKKLFARAIHNNSRRNNQSLVKVDCAGLRNDLTENELFGVTSATLDGGYLKPIGYLELAKGGTLFLDEIAELPLAFQSMLLQTIHDQENRRESGITKQTPGIRIIASTKHNLLKAVEQGAFREDLFYSLNVVPLRVPPLRERKADIPLLVDYFFNKHRIKLGSLVTTIEQVTLSKLTNYHWPGNVRELENVIERALILSEGSVLEIDESTFILEAIISNAQTVQSDENITGSHRLETKNESIGVEDNTIGKIHLSHVESGADPSGATNKCDDSSVLSQDDFEIAFKTVLQHYVETDSLQQSPLLFSNSVNAKVGTTANIGERVECLRALIMEATTSLSKHPKTEGYARILHRTYFQPARSQELAAESLGLGYSTYRRHLAKARSWLTAELWQKEQCNLGGCRT